MENNNSISGRGLNQIKLPRSNLNRPSPPLGFTKTQRQKLQSKRDPFNLARAFYRLKLLLEKDNDATPRDDIPSRGFYLNILV